MSEENRSPSEKVRRMLDERGIDYTVDDSDDYEITEWSSAYNLWWQFVYDPYEEMPYGELRLLEAGGSTHLTPEQAIAATVGRRDTMELWPEWEQVLFANVSDEVAQDNLNECVHELLDKAATVGRSCTSCPEMDNPDSYIVHLQSALKWHDEHVPRPTNPRNTCVVLKGERPPEEVLFVREDGEVMHYLPEDTCRNDGFKEDDEWYFVCSRCGCEFEYTDFACEFAEGHGLGVPKFCPNCRARVVSE